MDDSDVCRVHDGLDVCDVRYVPRCIDECVVLDVHDVLNDGDFHDVHVGRKVSMSTVSIQVWFTVMSAMSRMAFMAEMPVMLTLVFRIVTSVFCF